MKYNIAIKEQRFEVEVGEISQGMARVNVNGIDYDVRIDHQPDAGVSVTMPSSPAIPQRAPAVTVAPQRTIESPPPAPENLSGNNFLKAPMPGLILDVKVKVGDRVTAGQTVIIMEAMKMENSINAKINGTVKEIHVQKGAQVMTGHLLLVVE
jgi:glutaconyl-CoA/methylmalonyl-CoA decarboxylase subunit gamma